MPLTLPENVSVPWFNEAILDVKYAVVGGLPTGSVLITRAKSFCVQLGALLPTDKPLLIMTKLLEPDATEPEVIALPR